LPKVLILNDPKSISRRPFFVTLLAGMVLIITIVHLVRFVYAITWWRFLATLPGETPLWLASTGLVGLLVGAALFWGLWIGNPHSPIAARIIIPAYIGLLWIEQILSTWRGNKFENWPFTAAISLFVILFTYWTLSTPRAKNFFGALHEPSKKD